MLFQRYAHVVFARKNGLSADHGTLRFPAFGTAAKFITVADTTPASLLLPFLIKVRRRLHTPAPLRAAAAPPPTPAHTRHAHRVARAWVSATNA